MECHICTHYMKHVGKNWEETPCVQCELREDSHGTLPYWENSTVNALHDENPDDEVWNKEIPDKQFPQPYELVEEADTEDPKLPLSTLISAFSLWINLPLPTRKSIQLRMKNLPYSEIGDKLGVSRQAIEKAIVKALSKEPLLRNLLPSKEPRNINPLSATHHSAVADTNRRSGCRKKKSRK